MTRHSIQPPELFDSRQWGFSQVAVSPPGTIVNISGQVAAGADEVVTAIGRGPQLLASLQNLVIALEAAGGRADDLQILRIYLPAYKPADDGPEVARVLADFFGTTNPPAASWIGVQSLARPEFLVEVEAMAVITGSAAYNGKGTNTISQAAAGAKATMHPE